MASLKPGVLQKLLQNVGNKDAKVVGEHRSALLQVIGILPSLDDDSWRSRGFYLRVSDSMHSAYVSVLDEDVEFIMSDKIQLGQFIHVSRLDPSSPVPVLCGIKPVPKRWPCVGTPKDLISSDALIGRKTVDTKMGKKSAGLGKKVEVKETLEVKTKRVMESDMKSRRLSFSNGKVSGPEVKGKLEVKTKRMMENDDVKSGRLSFSNGKVSGPEVKSKLEVKTKRVMESDDAKFRRLSFSNTKVSGPEERRLSLDSMRKGWDQSPRGSNCALLVSKSKSKEGPCGFDSVKVIKKDSSNDPTSRHLLVSPLKSKNVMVSPKIPSKPLPIRRDVKSLHTRTPSEHPKDKKDTNCRNQSEPKILCSPLPDTIRYLGGEVRSHRNAAFSAAAHAVEEATATERVICCMRKFAELCESSDTDNTGPFVESFLNLHKDMENAAMVIQALVKTRILDTQGDNSCTSRGWLLPDACCDSVNKNALSWVQAAVENDLSKFSLLRKEEKKKGIRMGEKCIYVVVEDTPKKTETDNSPAKANRSPQNSHLQKSPSRLRGIFPTAKGVDTETKAWQKGSGLKDGAELAESLLSFSRGWFLNYLENLICKLSEMSTGERKPETASLLGQLKRVNRWLDESFMQGSRVDELIADLKKKLLGFLLDNVDSAIQSKS